MRRTAGKLADGREIIYFDDTQDAPPRVAVDTRDRVAIASGVRDIGKATLQWEGSKGKRILRGAGIASRVRSRECDHNSLSQPCRLIY